MFVSRPVTLKYSCILFTNFLHVLRIILTKIINCFINIINRFLFVMEMYSGFCEITTLFLKFVTWMSCHWAIAQLYYISFLTSENCKSNVPCENSRPTIENKNGSRQYLLSFDNCRINISEWSQHIFVSIKSFGISKINFRACKKFCALVDRFLPYQILEQYFK